MTHVFHNFILDWVPSSSGSIFKLWNFDPLNFDPTKTKIDPLTGPAKTGSWPNISNEHQLIPIGNYVLDWVPGNSGSTYTLWEVDMSHPNLLTSPKRGNWPNIDKTHRLIALPNYILDWVPGDTGQTSSFTLWQFDPQNDNPLAKVAQKGIWTDIDKNHRLIPFQNYVLDWTPNSPHEGYNPYRLWQFDPQNCNPLAITVQRSYWGSLNQLDHFTPIGDYVLDTWGWGGDTISYQVWDAAPLSDNDFLPTRAVSKSSWNQSKMSSAHRLVGLQSRVPIASSSPEPQTIEFMRSKIEHVVYYMIENRSFDHVCGWLYEHDMPNVIIPNSSKPFDGTSTNYFNYKKDGTTKVPVYKFKHGNMDRSISLDAPTKAGYHGFYWVINQLFGGSDKKYARKQAPPMMGFLDYNDDHNDAMVSYTPDQLPILNGLAKSFAVSDEWFSSFPGPTDVNRAFSLTGSSFGQTDNFESQPVYGLWPNKHHRPSIWNTLWSNGFRDWKIYYQDEWDGDCYTYHLFVKNHIPTVDRNAQQYVSPYQRFLHDIDGKNLPKFSYIEPAWTMTHPPITPNSYHPSSDLVPGEEKLNEIYNKLRNSDYWDKTLLIITFDEHGGLYDHVPPPYVRRPYANDYDHGFEFDLLGVRVPTILVSPWVAEKTVFRSERSIPYDATSFISTLLTWYGIPKEKWGLGARTDEAPTFESAFSLETMRTDKPVFIPPKDKDYPPPQAGRDNEPNDLNILFAQRALWHFGHKSLSRAELAQATDEILSQAHSLRELQSLVTAFRDKYAA